ncbi:MAG TPA: sterol desaturase family protein [Gammaproteobacteria bacterium]|nr:sterol desaturase family protein [Gammaproteobacteria bacterium]
MPRIIVFAVPFFLATVLLESLYSSWRRMRLYERRDTFASLAMGTGNLVLGLAFKGVQLGVYTLVWQHRLFDLPAHAWWVWLALLFADDFCYYWVHRFNHRVRLGWAGHVNHHSSRHFNLSTALRQSWTTLFISPWFYLPLALLGFPPLMILAMQSLNLLYQYWIHTETVHRMGPLEWVLNTPSHHRVHHGANPQYIDRNYAGIFILWDRLFGTFEPEREPVRYGLTRNIGTFNPLRIAFHEWRDLFRDISGTRRLRHALGYLVMPPGWSPRYRQETGAGE